jgi:hypothetical protein
MRRAVAAAGFVALACLVPRVAAAQSTGAEVALAEMLYREGRKLIADGKVSEACPKFAESYRLDAATGTLLNLASCHEAEHKFATAWLEYTEAIDLARRDRREDRIRFAQEHLASIEPKLSRLTVVVPPEVEAPDLEIQVDRVSVRRAAWGVPAPVDPGPHTVEARAKGRKTWSKEVAITRDATNVTVTIPALASDSVAPLAPAPVDLSGRPLEAEPRPGPVPSSVYVAGGLTLAFTAGAIATGIVYVSRRSKYGSSQLDAEFDTTRRWGLINLPLTGGVILGAAATTYLYLSRPSVSAQRGLGSTTTIAPWVAASSGGIVVEGAL